MVALKSLVTIVGHVADDGESAVTERGICYTTFESTDDEHHSLPTINNSKLQHKSIGTGSFTITMTPAQPSASYIVRPYVINGAGIAYGKAITFKTMALKDGETGTAGKDGAK